MPRDSVKKLLLSSSVAALGAVGGASAQEWSLTWGGYMSMHVGLGEISAPGLPIAVKTDGEGVDIHNESEIFFAPSVTLDNGLTFGVNVQLEGYTNAGPFIDESFVTISGDRFGTIEIGNTDSPGYKMMVSSPAVTTMWINSPSTSTFIPFTGVDIATGTLTALPFREAGISAYTEVGGAVNDDVSRLSYFTPDFNGLTIGLSYAPTAAINAGNSFSVNRRAVLSDVFDIGVNYSGTFGSTDITLAARWGTGDTPSVAAGASDFEAWGVGFQIGFSGFTIGGSYNENDNDETLIGAPAIGDSEGWALGATYDAAGAWSFEALTYQSRSDIAAVGITTPFKVNREAYRIGASRDLGPGVDWDFYLVHENRDDTRTLINDIKGTVLGTAINLSF